MCKLIINENNYEETGKWFSLPENPEFKFKIKPITQEDLKQVRGSYTSVQFDKKSHQKIEIEDPVKKRESTENLIHDSVVGWQGVKEKDENGGIIDAVFSKEKFKKLLNKNANWKLYVEYNEEDGENETITFSGWFMKIALDPTSFHGDDTENL